MPYDLYERHTVVSQLLQAKPSSDETKIVLDVGGRIGLLNRFMPYKTISINPDGTGHIVGDGTRLPFVDDSFDAVVNIDTLEHLPGHLRLPFIQECLRVSKQSVIIAAPYGNPGHVQLEKELNALHTKVLGKPHPYLSEHVEHGLPTPEQLVSFTQKLAATSQFHYAGDYSWQGRSFARAVQAHKQPRFLARLTHLYNQFSSMALFHPIVLSTKPNAQTNRFYLSLTK